MKEIYVDRLMMTELPANELSTSDITVTSAFLGKNPRSPMYGKIIGFFDKNNRTYKFTYNVHKPNSRNPHLSNKMTDLEEIITINGRPDTIDTEFGNKAFWDYTSLEHLKLIGDTDAYVLRKLMNKITKYSRRHDLCKSFRKTDKEAIALNPRFS